LNLLYPGRKVDRLFGNLVTSIELKDSLVAPNGANHPDSVNAWSPTSD
jgi:hypothetical protein